MDTAALLLVCLGAMLLADVLAKALGALTHVPGETLLQLVGAAAGPLGFDVLPDKRALHEAEAG